MSARPDSACATTAFARSANFTTGLSIFGRSSRWSTPKSHAAHQRPPAHTPLLAGRNHVRTAMGAWCCERSEELVRRATLLAPCASCCCDQRCCLPCAELASVPCPRHGRDRRGVCVSSGYVKLLPRLPPFVLVRKRRAHVQRARPARDLGWLCNIAGIAKNDDSLPTTGKVQRAFIMVKPDGMQRGLVRASACDRPSSSTRV